MKRKLIYVIIFISIFLMSSVRMVSPVQGYEPPDIPAEAKGMTLDDAEITVYDEDELEKRLGGGFDIKDIKAGDADIVGARSQMKILEWETDDDLVDYEKDFAWGQLTEAGHGDVNLGILSMAYNYTEIGGIVYVPYGPFGPAGFIANYSTTAAAALVSGIGNLTVLGGAQAVADQAQLQMAASIGTFETAIAKWGESYDGTLLEREVWDYLDPAEEFDPNDPDTDDDEVPYLLDPRDWRNAFDNMVGYTNEIYGEIDSIQQWWGSTSSTSAWMTPGWYIALAGGCAQIPGFTPGARMFDNFSAYMAVNDTIFAQLNAGPFCIRHVDKF